MSGELLLLSNSTDHGAELLAHARDALAEFYAGREVLFVPYALADHGGYADAVGAAFAASGLRLRSVHTESDPAAALHAAQAVWVGGGNSFRLLRALQRADLLTAMRAAVAAGARYGGASAGTNMACPTLRTTNDMPIVEPAGFAALGLVPFQINPHYVDADPASHHMGGGPGAADRRVPGGERRPGARAARGRLAAGERADGRPCTGGRPGCSAAVSRPRRSVPGRTCRSFPRSSRSSTPTRRPRPDSISDRRHG